MQITAYRKSLGLTQEAFGALFGLKSKGQVSEIEKDNRCSAEVALAIEAHSNHQVDAATLNDVVRAARLQAA
jgi:transcriptional regulator with XRE-family HTH domain